MVIRWIFFSNFASMEFYSTGIIIAVSTFLVIGFFHPIVIRTEYHFGTRPWWVFLLGGIAMVCCSLCVADVILSSLLGVIGASMLWSIGELFSQKKRVEKGWFPMNPKRKDDYKPIPQDESLCPMQKGKSKYVNEDNTFIGRKDAGQAFRRSD